jgi:hypothetical protein
MSIDGKPAVPPGMNPAICEAAYLTGVVVFDDFDPSNDAA